MTVGELIKRLQEIDPETIVAKLHTDPEGDRSRDGYDEVHFLAGSHEEHEDSEPQFRYRLKKNRRIKFIKGRGAPDYVHTDCTSRAKELHKLLLIY